MLNNIVYETVEATFNIVEAKIYLTIRGQDLNEYCKMQKVNVKSLFDTPFAFNTTTKIYGVIFERDT